MASNEILHHHSYMHKEHNERVVRHYDFKETNRFPKECMQILHTIYANYVRALTSNLAARIGRAVDVELKSISQMTFEEYDVMSRTDNVTFIFEMEPMDRFFYLNLSNEIAFVCIDSICGGSVEYKQVAREFTDLEKSLLNLIAAYLLEPVNSSWKNYLDVKTKFKSIELHLENTQYFTPQDLIVLVDFVIIMSDGSKYSLNFILPYHSMENQIDNLISANQINLKTMEPCESSMDLIGQHLKNSLVDLEVVLGKTTLTLSEINQLQVGNVFSVDRKVGELLPLVVENQAYFLGQLGILKKKLAIQVLEVLNNPSEGDY